jgi:uncharacterized protein (TIGR02145 family)
MEVYMFLCKTFAAAASVVFLIAIFSCSKDNPAQPAQQQLVIEDGPSVTDFDGNAYKTVKIGNQTWMAENLRSTHYSDGTLIQSFAYGDDTANVGVYGRLYRSAAALKGASGGGSTRVQGAAPVGWHIPSVAEWQALVDNLGGNAVAGGKLKAAGTDRWKSPNTGATNESKFRALPGGYFRVDGLYMAIGERAIFLTTSSPDPLMVRGLRNSTAEVISEQFHPLDALSLRCVKD